MLFRSIVCIMDSDCEDDLSDLNYCIKFNHTEDGYQGWYDIMVHKDDIWAMTDYEANKFGKDAECVAGKMIARIPFFTFLSLRISAATLKSSILPLVQEPITT